MKKIISLVLLLSVTTTSGCATLFTGSNDKLKVSSTHPEETHITIKNMHGQVVYQGAPDSVKLKKGDGFFRGSKYTVEAVREGYETQTSFIDTSFSGWYLLGNLPIAFVGAGILGYLIVDPISGAMYKLKPDNVKVKYPNDEVAQ